MNEITTLQALGVLVFNIAWFVLIFVVPDQLRTLGLAIGRTERYQKIPYGSRQILEGATMGTICGLWPGLWIIGLLVIPRLWI